MYSTCRPEWLRQGGEHEARMLREYRRPYCDSRWPESLLVKTQTVCGAAFAVGQLLEGVLRRIVLAVGSFWKVFCGGLKGTVLGGPNGCARGASTGRGCLGSQGVCIGESLSVVWCKGDLELAGYSTWSPEWLRQCGVHGARMFREQRRPYCDSRWPGSLLGKTQTVAGGTFAVGELLEGLLRRIAFAVGSFWRVI